MGAEFHNIDLRILPLRPPRCVNKVSSICPYPKWCPAAGTGGTAFSFKWVRSGEFELANRTYYLTRSQPPFLTQMILAVYRNTQDRNWLADAWSAIEQYYNYWTQEPPPDA
jgi:hypothetical protein